MKEKVKDVFFLSDLNSLETKKEALAGIMATFKIQWNELEKRLLQIEEFLKKANKKSNYKIMFSGLGISLVKKYTKKIEFLSEKGYNISRMSL